jgi:hypothetical protein
MRPLIIFALTGALVVNLMSVVEARPTTRLPPAPLPSELTHSNNIKTNIAHSDYNTSKQKAKLTQKKTKKKTTLKKKENS